MCVVDDVLCLLIVGYIVCAGVGKLLSPHGILNFGQKKESREGVEMTPDFLP